MIVYLNGNWRPLSEAHISVEDRGFMFADGVYEVVRYFNGRGLAMDEHVERLSQSLEAIRIPMPDGADLDRISDTLVEKNQMPDASVYWQVTRGVAPRRHAFPLHPTEPTVLAMAYPAEPLTADQPIRAIAAITRPDIRWRACSIKSTMLIPAVLDAQAAVEADCQLAILVRDGHVIEGSSSSVFAVQGDQLLTHPLDGTLLDSITRRIAIRLAEPCGLKVREKPVSVEAFCQSDEVIAVGTTTLIASVTQIDRKPVGSGQVGPVAAKLFEAFKKHVQDECGNPKL